MFGIHQALDAVRAPDQLPKEGKLLGVLALTGWWCVILPERGEPKAAGAHEDQSRSLQQLLKQLQLPERLTQTFSIEVSGRVSTPPKAAHGGTHRAVPTCRFGRGNQPLRNGSGVAARCNTVSLI